MVKYNPPIFANTTKGVEQGTNFHEEAHIADNLGHLEMAPEHLDEADQDRWDNSQKEGIND